MVFTYLDAFCTDEHFAEFLPDYANLEEMKAHRRGGLGDGTCKKFLFNVLEETLAPIREERARWAKDIDTVYDILAAGTVKAAETPTRRWRRSARPCGSTTSPTAPS